MSISELLTALEKNAPLIESRQIYLDGRQPLRFTSDKVDSNIMGFRANLADVAVTAVAEKIRIANVTAEITTGAFGNRVTQDVSRETLDMLEDCDFTMMLQSLVQEMLGVGTAFLLVWADEFGRAVVTGESARHVAVNRHPLTGAVVEAVKRIFVTDSAGRKTSEHVWHYTAKRVVELTRDEKTRKLKFVRSDDNPLGVVPVVPLVNVKHLAQSNSGIGSSVVDSLAPLLDALNKIIVDMLVTSESVARPKRFATGVVLEDDEDEFLADDVGFMADMPDDEDGEAGAVLDLDTPVKSPFSDSDGLWISEQAEAKFGQLPGADLGGYKTAVDLIVQQIMAVTALPSHMVGVTTANPATAEALQASEAALASRSESRLPVINKPVQWGIRMMVAAAFSVSPHDVRVRIKWAPTKAGSIAQEADAAVKLAQQDIVTTDEARELVSKETI